MQFFNRFAQGRLRLTRIEAFSDGVFAIVVTLLVLELKVPSLQEVRDEAAVNNGECYITYFNLLVERVSARLLPAQALCR